MSLRTIATSIALVVASLVGATTTAPPAAADPPTNGRIAYVDMSDQEDFGLWTIEPDGSAPVLVAASTEYVYAIFPEWSPDGSRLAFVSVDTRTDPSSSSVSIVSPTGAMRVDLPIPARWSLFMPELAWSPDGSRLALPLTHYGTSPDDPTEYTIAIVPVNGAPPIFVGGPARGDYSLQWYRHLEWSPDGSVLAFAHGAFNAAVGSVRADGTDYRIFADYSTAPTFLNVAGPTWLTNTRLAVGVRTMGNPCCTGETGSIWGIDSDGTDPAPILADAGLFNFSDFQWRPGYPEPRTSPDRTMMALRGGGIGRNQYGEPNRSGLWVLDVDGTGVHEIAPEIDYGDDYASPDYDWSPDSRHIVWADTNDRDGSDVGLRVRRADGSTPAVTLVEGAVSYAKWAPDPPPAAQDHVAVRVTGKYNYNASADLSSGNLEVALTNGSINTVGGTGTYPGTNGGIATIGVNARRFWILPFYLGNVTVNDTGAGLNISYPLFFNKVARTPTGATFTASWFDTRGTFGGYTATVTIDDLT